MIVNSRRAAIVTTLFLVAGCSGGTLSQSPSLGLQTANAVVHRGVPMALPMLHTMIRPQTSGKYSTKKSLVFEGDQAEAAVNVYQTAALASNPAPIATIHVATGCPYGLAMNKSGTLYVADNCAVGDVEEYSKGSTTMKAAITDGISYPLGLAIDSKENLYVSNYPAAITVYAKGSTSPSETITGGGLTDPFGLAIDKSGNLYIADFGAAAILEVKAGTTTVQNSGLTGVGEPIGLAIDKKTGYLWETGGEDNIVNVYDLATSTSPIETFSGQGDPYAIGLENAGKPKGEVVESDLGPAGQKYVYAYKPNSYTPYADLSNDIDLPTGLLIAKP
jgi:DNA-binding beta-propeller fold protein YncE